MQLKTVEEVADDLWATVDYETGIDYQEIMKAVTQDRQDTITAVIEMVNELREAEWVADGESNYLEALNDVEAKLQALSPKE